MNYYFKSILLSVCTLLSLNIFSQNEPSKDRFIGVWELQKIKRPEQSNYTTVPPGMYKLFTIDGNLQMFSVTNKGSVITQYGTYKMLTDTTYEESFVKSIYFPDPKPGTIIYNFQDYETLNSKYGFTGGYSEEIWRKLPYAGDKQ